MNAVNLPIQVSGQQVPVTDAAVFPASISAESPAAGVPGSFAEVLLALQLQEAFGESDEEGAGKGSLQELLLASELVEDADTDKAELAGSELVVPLPWGLTVPAQAPVQMQGGASAERAPAKSEVVALGDLMKPTVADEPAVSLPAAATAGSGEAANSESLRQAIAAAPAAFAAEGPVVQAVASDGVPAATQTVVVQPMMQAPVSASTSAPVAATASAIPQHVDSSAWGNALGERVVWMVGQQHQGVELHLNPPALGPLEVRLSMSDGQANLTFSTHHAPVRDAIEAATPRLREMLGESGINLGSVSVNVGTFSQQQAGEQGLSQRPAVWTDPGMADFSTMLPTAVTVLGRQGMVDIFA